MATAHGLADATDIAPVRHSLSAVVAANDWLGRNLVRVNKAAPIPLQAGYVPDESAVRLGLPQRPQDLTVAQTEVVAEAKRRFGPMLVTYPLTDRVTPEVCSFPYCDTPLRAGVRVRLWTAWRSRSLRSRSMSGAGCSSESATEN